LKCGQIYIQTQWTPVLPLAKERGKPYVIKELIMGEILAYKHFSKRNSRRFHCWSTNCKDYLECKRTSNMKMPRIHL